MMVRVRLDNGLLGPPRGVQESNADKCDQTWRIEVNDG